MTIRAERTCVGCGGRFTPQPYSHYPDYCSTGCRPLWGTLPKDTRHSPANWDGKTTYSSPLVRRGEYETRCISCGRGEWLHLTAAEARALRLMQCQQPGCGGRVFVSPASGVTA